jgi:hypothetical protein
MAIVYARKGNFKAELGLLPRSSFLDNVVDVRLLCYPASVKILDLTQAYCSSVALTGDWRPCERHYPALFRHYFRFWAKRSYPDVKTTPADLLVSSQLVTRRLSKIVRKLADADFDLEGVDFVLFVGKGCTNGHAFSDNGQWVVWIPVETYTTARLVDVFVTHEIAHALHYRESPRFYFQDKIEQRSFSRQLLTEGIATYLTAIALDCSDDLALWGGFLPRAQLRRWRRDCEADWPMLLRLARKLIKTSSRTELFQANDPANIMKFRAGYLVGLELIKKIAVAGRLSPNQLISVPRRKLEQRALEVLAANSK